MSCRIVRAVDGKVSESKKTQEANQYGMKGKGI